MMLKDLYTPQQICGAVLSFDIPNNHHPLGGSSLYRRVKCPASAIAEKIDGVERKSDDADKGRFLHSEIESYLNVGDTGTDNHHVLNASRYVQSIKDSHVALAQYTEHRVSIPDDNGKEIAFGTIDWIGIANERDGYIRDWKTGANWETVHDSQIYQGRFYIAAAIFTFNLQYCDFRTFETGEGVEKVEIGARDRQWAIEFREQLIKLRDKCYSTEAEFAESTGDYCQYCKCGRNGSSTCPVLQREAREAADCLGLEIPIAGLAMTTDEADDLMVKATAVIGACEIIKEQARQAIIAAGGSARYMVCQVKGRETIDWKTVAKEANVPPCIIERNTKVGEPSASVRARKKGAVQ